MDSRLIIIVFSIYLTRGIFNPIFPFEIIFNNPGGVCNGLQCNALWCSVHDGDDHLCNNLGKVENR